MERSGFFQRALLQINVALVVNMRLKPMHRGILEKKFLHSHFFPTIGRN
jgi:hypothetical protein